MTKKEIMKTEWAETISLITPSIFQEALELAANNPNVLILKNDELGKTLYAVVPTKKPDFWFDAFKFKKDAIRLCKEMGWKFKKTQERGEKNENNNGSKSTI